MTKQQKSHRQQTSKPPNVSLSFDESQKSENRREEIRLVRLAKQGNQNAFKELRLKYHGALTHFVARLVNRREEVDDLVQEAFIKAFTSIQNYNEEFAFSTWLFKIAANNSIDYLRKKKLHTFSINTPFETEDEEYTFELPDTDLRPDQLLISNQRSKMLEEAMESLPPKYRQVIYMRHVEEMEYSEIAKALDEPLGTVKAHIFRAREMLYKQLKHKIRHYE
ncbi:MAG TPA: sigma-70 family RNA polymerase sigma factor [Bacteroidota bacterium]|nr:sigma-70 family RNA polymerase sigma factor [Bacteroidota bacterium]